MIHLLELDLAQARPCLPPVDGEAWILIRHGPVPLGEARLRLDARHVGRTVEDLLEAHAHRVYAREVVRAAVPSSGVPPDQVSIVVCTRERPQLLVGCLDALRLLDPGPGEVLVVDNAPTTTATAQVVERYGVRRLVEPRPGLDNARNRGWREASGQVVAFVDDDARVDRFFAEMIGGGFLSETIGAVTGLVLPAELLFYPQIAFERIEGGMRKGFAPTVFGPGAAAVGHEPFRLGVGTNMAFRRSVLEALGGFDPILDVGTPTRGGGDVDALWRALREGYAIFYQPSAIVRHIHRRDRAGLLAQLSDYGTSHAAWLELRARRSPDDAMMVRRHRRRWHLDRHIVRPLRAAMRRELLELQMYVAEARGSRRGAAALAAAEAEQESTRQTLPLSAASSRRASVVIRTYNEEARLGAALDGVFSQSVAPHEVIVIDSGSTDATVEVAGRYPVRILHMRREEWGYSRALNRAAAAATGDILVSLSAHCTPLSPDWLGNLLRHFDDPQVAAAWGPNFRPGRPVPPPGPPERQLPGSYGIHNRAWGLTNSNSAIRRAFWEQFPFDEKLPATEDKAWAMQAMARDFCIVHDPAAGVWHHRHGIMAAYRRDRAVGAGFALMFPEHRLERRHHVARTFLRAALLNLSFHARTRSLRLIASDLRRLPTTAAAITGHLAGLKRKG